jgi:hypothetical protein
MAENRAVRLGFDVNMLLTTAHVSGAAEVIPAVYSNR